MKPDQIVEMRRAVERAKKAGWITPPPREPRVPWPPKVREIPADVIRFGHKLVGDETFVASRRIKLLCAALYGAAWSGTEIANALNLKRNTVYKNISRCQPDTEDGKTAERISEQLMNHH